MNHKKIIIMAAERAKINCMLWTQAKLYMCKFMHSKQPAKEYKTLRNVFSSKKVQKKTTMIDR